MRTGFYQPAACFCWAWLVVAGSGLAGCSRAHEPTQTSTPPPHTAAAATTNVPALLGASIDVLRHRLGAVQPLPPGFINPLQVVGSSTATSQDSLLSFRTGGLTLIASYDARSRQVNDLLLLGQREDSLMARATLRSNASNYLVLPVFRPDKPGRLLGLRIVSVSR